MSESSPPPEPSVPPEIPGYEFVGIIRSGGQATVYRYRSTRPQDVGDEYAVKVYRRAKSADADDEIRTLRSFRHNAIVTPIPGQHGTTADGRRYFVMPLYHRLDDGREFTVREVLEIGIVLAGALAYAHADERDVWHLDVKPANVLMDDDGNPLLADFGISRRTGDFGGGLSFAWSPPEQQRRQPVSALADVFSLGAMLLVVLARGAGTGAPRSVYDVPGGPNDDATRHERAVRNEVHPPDLDEALVPPALQRVLRKAVAADPAERWASAAEFRDALAAMRPALLGTAESVTLTWPRGEDPSAASSDADVPDAPEEATAPAPEEATASAPESATASASAPSAPAPESAGAVGLEFDPGTGPEAGTTTLTSLAPPGPDRPDGSGTASGPGSTPDPVPDPPRGRLLRVAATLAGLLVLVVVLVVAVPAILELPSDLAETPSTDNETPFATVVPTPVLDGASRTGDVVTFTWSNPEPVDGDSYIWTRTDGPNDAAATPTDEGVAVIDDVADATVVCIEVVVRRDGRTSATPLSTCFPE